MAQAILTGLVQQARLSGLEMWKILILEKNRHLILYLAVIRQATTGLYGAKCRLNDFKISSLNLF